MQTLANQVGQALSGDAFSFRFMTNDAHDPHDFGPPIDVIAPDQAFARVLLVEAGATREIIFFIRTHRGFPSTWE
jgi:hypothetical protein